MLTLIAAKNTVAVAAHISLEETGMPYTVTWLDFSKGDQQSADYLKVNPKARVPSLVTDTGVITETPAILEYVGEAANSLIPENPFLRAKMREMLAYCASTFHVNHAHKLRGARWSDDAGAHASMQAKVPQTMAESCAYIETQLPGSGWLLGDLTLADIHLHTICRWLAGDGVDITAYPKLAAHFAAMQARPSLITIEKAHG